MYETFEHTADLGLRVEAPDLPGLFAEAGRGLASMMVAHVEAVESREERMLTIEGADPEYLLFDWLTELLYIFDSQRLLLTEFQIQIDDRGLRAVCRGETLDPDLRLMNHEVKAITYHGLRVEQTGEGWRAEVIVDI
jgi:SHS2 domain-containing protein